MGCCFPVGRCSRVSLFEVHVATADRHLRRANVFLIGIPNRTALNIGDPSPTDGAPGVIVQALKGARRTIASRPPSILHTVHVTVCIMVAYGTSCRRPGHSVVMSKIACHRSDCRFIDSTFGLVCKFAHSKFPSGI